MLELAASMAEVAKKSDLSLLELSYGFLSGHPQVDSILLGPATVAQLDVALDALAQRLPTETSERIDSAYRNYLGTDARYAR